MEIIGIIILLVYGIPLLGDIISSIFPDKCNHGIRKDSGAICSQCKIEKSKMEEQRELDKIEDLKRIEREQREKEERKKLLELELESERKIREIKEREKLEKLKRIDGLIELSPVSFENVVLRMYENLGYKTISTKASGDCGIDGYLRKDGELWILQCKKFANTKVGSPILRDLLGVCAKEAAFGGKLVTTSDFTEDAKKWAIGLPLELINGIKLIELMNDGFSIDRPVEEVFVEKSGVFVSMPEKCGRCGSVALKRFGIYGEFVGCSMYPDCRWTWNFETQNRDNKIKSKYKYSRRRFR